MATATHEPITREQALSEQELVRLNVARRVNQLTNDGDELIQFMLDTVRGEFHDAKFCHRERAAINLAVMSGKLPQDTPGSDVRVVREEGMPKPQDNPQADHQQAPRRVHTRRNRWLPRPHRQDDCKSPRITKFGQILHAVPKI